MSAEEKEFVQRVTDNSMNIKLLASSMTSMKPHLSTCSDGGERADAVCTNPQMAGLGTTAGGVVVKVVQVHLY